MRPFSYRTGTNRFSSEVIDCVAVPVLTDYLAGMYAVGDIDLDENFQDAWEAIEDVGFLSRESFLEETNEYIHSIGDTDTHFEVAMMLVVVVAKQMTDDEWHDFLAKHYEAIKKFFPKYTAV